MEIYLVRHGAAYTKEDDPERHLNKNGLDQCHMSGRAEEMQAAGLKGLILSAENAP